MSFNSDLSKTTRVAPFNLDFEVDSTCTTVPPAVQLSTDSSSVQIDSITVSSSSKKYSDSTRTAADTVEETRLLPHLPIAKKKSKRRRNKKVQNSGYHPRCLPRSITENKKLSYHLRIEKILSDKSLQLFRPQLLCEVCNTQSNSENQLQLHFNSKNHKSSVWKLTPKYCAPCGVFSRFQTSQLWDAHLSSKKHQKRVGLRTPGEYGFPN